MENRKRILSIARNGAVVKRFFDDVCNARRYEIAGELLTTDFLYHDPQIPGVAGPEAMAQVIKTYVDALKPTWRIDELTEGSDERVTVRCTLIGRHTGQLPGMTDEPSGRIVEVDWIMVFRVQQTKIAEIWCVWDALTFLKQIGGLPADGVVDYEPAD